MAGQLLIYFLLSPVKTVGDHLAVPPRASRASRDTASSPLELASQAGWEGQEREVGAAALGGGRGVMAREATHGGLLAGGKRGRVKEAATRDDSAIASKWLCNDKQFN